jgi:hypothetical protein
MAILEFDNSEDKGTFTPLPEGTYDLQIMVVEQGTSQKGNPQLKISCEVASGEKEGRKVTLWYSLVKNSAWKLKRLLVATGAPFEENDAGKLRFDTDDLVERFFTVDASVGVNPVSGKPKNDFDAERPSAMGAAPVPAVAPAPAAIPVQPSTVSAAAQAIVGSSPAPGEFRRRSRA